MKDFYSILGVKRNAELADIKKEFKRLLAEPIKDAKIYKSPAKGLILKEIFYED